MSGSARKRSWHVVHKTSALAILVERSGQVPRIEAVGIRFIRVVEGFSRMVRAKTIKTHE